MKNNFIYNSEFSNIYERPNDNSNVSTQILFGENFSILKKSKNFYKIKILFKYVKEEGSSLIMVTHDPKLANCASRKIKIKDGKIK